MPLPRFRLRADRMFVRVILLAALVALAACAQPTPPLPDINITVDGSLAPSRPSLPGFEDGEPRPLAAVTGEDGQAADFVANEVWLVTDDAAELQAFLTRWSGTVLKTFDAQAAGLTDVGTQYLVRVDVGANPDPAASLAADLRALDKHATGDHRVSSTQGLNLLGVTSHEAAAGLKVGVNWVGSGAGPFLDRTTAEAPTGQALGGVAYDPNAFNWPSHSATAPQEIGVAEAWRALDLAGKLGNRVKLAILDMGFEPDTDTPSGWLAIPNVPLYAPTGTENLLSCGGGDCPWHGQMVSSAAMARADNAFGGAGPAGPVADAVLVFTLYDFFTSITALGEARIAGARIANMSYSAPVPWYLGWSVLPFEAATYAFRQTGMLLFAAAGNDGKNVDGEECTLGACWERTWVTPCENAGVICVGGMRANSTMRAGDSNYGADQVDIFAPFTLWLGPDPSAPNNTARALNGTSFSSPFTAGVAALIWAANPGLSADQVEHALLTTAHANSDSQVRRHVNALGAVKSVLGNVPPAITLSAGGDVPMNVPVFLEATVTDLEDAFPCCSLTWTSSRDGVLGTDWQIQHTFTTVGSRVITASATDSGGATSTASITLNVVNYAPVVTISAPLPGAEVFRTATVNLRGAATDRNEPNEELACTALTWTSSNASDPFPLTGCIAQAAFATNGARTLTLTGTDGMGASGSASVSITVVDPPPNLPPTVQVTSPANGTSPPIDEPLTLSGTAVDPEDQGPLTYQWTVKLGVQAPIVVGNSATVQWTPHATYPFDQEGTWSVEVRLTVTDAAGNVGSDFVTLVWVLIF
ncbi:MAG TPA: S8 family serine peptidase [Trueperaceae bacterium]|nr:S8 family serine peptidase [Trueperaceae bacterium]